MHDLDRALGGIDGDAGEARGQFPGAEPVVAVPVSGVDVGQPLAGPLDPVADALDLRKSEGRVDGGRPVSRRPASTTEATTLPGTSPAGASRRPSHTRQRASRHETAGSVT